MINQFDVVTLEYGFSLEQKLSLGQMLLSRRLSWLATIWGDVLSPFIGSKLYSNFSQRQLCFWQTNFIQHSQHGKRETSDFTDILHDMIQE